MLAYDQRSLIEQCISKRHLWFEPFNWLPRAMGRNG